MTKIGFDFGKTIGEIEEDQPYPQCFETLTMFIRKLGADRVYIISKAKTEMKEKITEWLTTQNFFTTTGFNRDNMYFVEEYSEKRVLVDKLQINIFVDDSVKVVRYLVDSPHINKMVWFRGESRLLKEISGKYREKVIISNHWNKLHKLVEFF